MSFVNHHAVVGFRAVPLCDQTCSVSANLLERHFTQALELAMKPFGRAPHQRALPLRQGHAATSARRIAVQLEGRQATRIDNGTDLVQEKVATELRQRSRP